LDAGEVKGGISVVEIDIGEVSVDILLEVEVDIVEMEVLLLNFAALVSTMNKMEKYNTLDDTIGIILGHHK